MSGEGGPCRGSGLASGVRRRTLLLVGGERGKYGIREKEREREGMSNDQ